MRQAPSGIDRHPVSGQGPTAVASPVPAVELRGIVKRFPGVVANDGVDFALATGEVHALLGENGAGKSTLMNILDGLYQPDAGEILIDGRPVAFRSPRDAIAAGLGMVHQHFTLVASMTVTENVLIGLDRPRFRLDLGRYDAEIGRLAEAHGLRVDPRAKVWQLSVGERQRVEILKVLYRGARVLIMDEPTAVLAPQEIDDLFRTLRSMTAAGRSVVFISHKLGEVLAIADRITVMRRGKVTAAALPAAGCHEGPARPADGRPRGPREPRADAGAARATSCSRSSDVEARRRQGRARRCAASRSRSAPARSSGIAAVAGNGQSELAEVITRPAAVPRPGPGRRRGHRQPAGPQGDPARRGARPRGPDRRRHRAEPVAGRQPDHEALPRLADRSRLDRSTWAPPGPPRASSRTATTSRLRRSTPRPACSPAATSSA